MAAMYPKTIVSAYRVSLIQQGICAGSPGPYIVRRSHPICSVSLVRRGSWLDSWNSHLSGFPPRVPRIQDFSWEETPVIRRKPFDRDAAGVLRRSTVSDLRQNLCGNVQNMTVSERGSRGVMGASCIPGLRLSLCPKAEETAAYNWGQSDSMGHRGLRKASFGATLRMAGSSNNQIEVSVGCVLTDFPKAGISLMENLSWRTSHLNALHPGRRPKCANIFLPLPSRGAHRRTSCSTLDSPVSHATEQSGADQTAKGRCNQCDLTKGHWPEGQAPGSERGLLCPQP